jgi:hypothetical protein
MGVARIHRMPAFGRRNDLVEVSSTRSASFTPSGWPTATQAGSARVHRGFYTLDGDSPAGQGQRHPVAPDGKL